jgi:hypothetical protein
VYVGREKYFYRGSVRGEEKVILTVVYGRSVRRSVKVILTGVHVGREKYFKNGGVRRTGKVF